MMDARWLTLKLLEARTEDGALCHRLGAVGYRRRIEEINRILDEVLDAVEKWEVEELVKGERP